MYTKNTLFSDLPEYMREKYYKNQHIQLFCGDKLVTDIMIKDKHVTYKKYGHKFDSLFMSDDPINPEYIYSVFTTRVIENFNDSPTKQWLKYYDLQEYDVYELIRVMHGIQSNDNYYFIFDDEIDNPEISIKKMREYAMPTVENFEKKIGEKICFR